MGSFLFGVDLGEFSILVVNVSKMVGRKLLGCFVIISLPLLSVTPALAQVHNSTTDTGYVQDVKVYNGKEFGANEMEKINHVRDSANASYIGRMYMPFDLIDQDGRHICTASSTDKVTLLVFREPTDNHHLQELKDLYDKYRKSNKFLMVIVTFDTNSTKRTMAEANIQLPFAGVRWMSDMQHMSFHNGTPSFVVLNKYGVVSYVSGGHMNSKEDMLEPVKKNYFKPFIN